jgi:predicted dienelactone hydrolase
MERRIAWVLVVAGVCTACVENGTAYKADAGPHLVASATADWHDAARDRTVPVKMYAPETSAVFPAIVLSHGLGGSREGLSYLGNHWASHGYVVIAVTHEGSDREAVAAGGWDLAVHDPEIRRARPDDVRFVVDRLVSEDHGEPLIEGRIDPGRIGVAGASYGAFTALSVAGQTFDDVSVPDPRVTAAVALSPQGPGVFGLSDASWDTVSMPTMTMAGTQDTTSIVRDALDRRVPFDSMPPGERFHVTMRHATHGSFGGQTPYKSWIQQLTTAFWDHCLKQDRDAHAWLLDDEVRTVSRHLAHLETKP